MLCKWAQFMPLYIKKFTSWSFPSTRRRPVAKPRFKDDGQIVIMWAVINLRNVLCAWANLFGGRGQH